MTESTPLNGSSALKGPSPLNESKHIHELGRPDEDGQHPHEAPHLDPEMSDVPTTARRRRPVPLRRELPLLLWLVAAWMAMTRDFTLLNLFFGSAAAWTITHVFRLPPVDLAGRFNVWKALLLGMHLVGQAFAASFRVFWLAVRQGPRVKSSIVRIRLVTHDDLILTAVSHALAIVPGSIVCEVDRDNSTLYVHVLGAVTDSEVDRFVCDARRTELRILEIMGRPDELEMARKARSEWEHGAAASVSAAPEKREETA